MTRFARAQGSRSSNQREAEDSTPWHVMVANIRKEGPPPKKKRMGNDKNYQTNFSDNIEELDGVGYLPETDSEGEEPVCERDVGDDAGETKSEMKHKTLGVVLAESQVKSDHEEVQGSKKKNPRKQNKCLNCKQPGHLKKECPDLPEERRKELQNLFVMKVERKGQGTGRKKNKVPLLTDSLQKTEFQNEDSAKPKFSKNQQKHKKIVKDKAGQVVEEGEGLFQVKKEDGDRLRKLHKKLVAEKATKEEMKEVLKRERRRAEKALSNLKKFVCYNCRQPGHALAECPEAQNDLCPRSNKPSASRHEIISGVCFKCGSAEHTSRDCKSKQKGDLAYQFATCFICKQTGHLAKACPDNPKGLYPKGGGCRFCGSVEHLKSDCPRKVEKDARSEVRVARAVGEFVDEVEELPDRSAGGLQKKKAARGRPISKVVSF